MAGRVTRLEIKLEGAQNGSAFLAVHDAAAKRYWSIILEEKETMVIDIELVESPAIVVRKVLNDELATANSPESS